MLIDAGSRKLEMLKPAWYQAIGKYAYSNLNKSLWQIIDTFVPYCVLWALMLYTVRQGYPYWVNSGVGIGGRRHPGSGFYPFSRLLSRLLLCIAPGKYNPGLRLRYFDIHPVRRLAVCPQYTSCHPGRR